MNALAIGIVSGIASYFVIQLFLRCLRPKVIISNKIAESASTELIYTYRIKVQNLSKRDIGDITMIISYRSKKKGHYTFSVKDIPLLHSIDLQGNSFTSKINPAQISESKIEPVRDFFSNNPTGFIEIEMSFSDKSSWGFIWGNIRWTAIKKYSSANDIVENSIFVESSMEPEPLQDYKNRYNNC